MLDFFPKTAASDIFRKFLTYFPIGLAAVVVILWMIARLEYDQGRMAAADRERSQVQQVQRAVVHDLAMLASDLSILAASDALKTYLASPSPATLAALTERLRAFAEDKPLYDRVAYLDHAGRELAGSDRTAAPERRQGGYLDHVQETLLLSPGDIAVRVSDDDGKGGAAGPGSPMLYLSMPVFDAAGQNMGLILLSCRTSRLLDRFFESHGASDQDRVLIVNHRGIPVRVATAKDHGGLLPAVDRPELWQALQNRPEGEIQTADGFLTFVRIDPAREIQLAVTETRQDQDGGRNDRQGAEEYAWYILSFTPAPPDPAFLALFRQDAHVLLVLLGLAMLAAGSLHLSINRANKERSDRAVELLSTAIEQSPAAAVITDGNGLIRYANPKFLAMSGYCREEIVGRNPRLFKSGETPAEVYADLWQTVRAGRVWIGEFRNKRKDNSQYIVAAKISPIQDKSGAISGYLAIQEDVTETRRLQQQLERLATVDGLTGTYNRSHFLHLFNQELRREERYGQPLCLLIFDIDHFKAINDSYGHQAGDRVLEAFARLVGSILRDTDIFGRLGGEEFGVVLLQTDDEGASLLAERLRAAIESMRVTCEGRVIQLTASIGGTAWERHDHTIEAILNRADNALYEAKRMGRNRVCFRFAPEGREREN